MIQELFTKPILVFGCGNPLFGDDGFGPAVVEHLMAHHALPEFVLALDAGTGLRDLLFDLLLSPVRPLQIHIVDAVCLPNRQPGQLFELDLEEIPASKTSDFSLHQFPSVNLLREMNSLGHVHVHVLAVQAGHIPDFVKPGLSPEVRKAIEPACKRLLCQIGGAKGDRHVSSVLPGTAGPIFEKIKIESRERTT